MPRVSVIIPTYNRPEFLSRAMQSVLAQTYSDFELLVIHNGPLSELREVVKRYELQDTRVKYHYLEKADAVTARNYGIENAAGEYVAFLDDDDEWLPKKLEKQVAKLVENSDVGLVSCHAPIYIESQKSECGMRQWQGFMSFKRFLISGCVIRSLSCVLVRRACFERTGVFNPKFPIANDYEFYFKLLQKYRIFMLKESLVKKHQHDSNMTSGIEEMNNETISVIKALRNCLLESCGVSKRLLEKVIRLRSLIGSARLFYSIAEDAMDAGRYGLACNYFFKSILRCPTIGTKTKWSRSKNFIYRFLRPYAAAIYCGSKQLYSSIKPERE